MIKTNTETQARQEPLNRATSAPLRLCVSILLISLATCGSVMAQASTKPALVGNESSFPEAREILARIKAPTFADRKFPITDFGATPGETSDATEAIKKAIAACNAAGGGHVIVPAGTFLTGAIHLKSNVDLHLEEGSTLLFKTDPKAYLPVVFTRFEGMEFFNYSPFIYALDQENIAITGEGTLDGQADAQHWWPWARSASAQNQRDARARLTDMVERNLPVEQRQFGENQFMRPVFVQPYRCKNVLIEGIKIRRSPMWEINPVLCTNVIVRKLDIVSHGVNNDGCNPEASRDVLIEDCLFDTGDDCIAIKSGRNNDGRRLGVASENIIIRNCTMKDGHGGVTIGSEISGSCRNVFVENCTMDSANLDRVLRIKSNAIRGGTIENIHMRNVQVGQVADAILQIDFVYEGNPQDQFKPIARNITMENITSQRTPRVLNVVGCTGSTITNVRIINSVFQNVQRPDVIRDAQDVQLVDSKVERSQ